MNCNKCNAELKENTNYCPKCGAKVEESDSKVFVVGIIALIICSSMVLLGGCQVSFGCLTSGCPTVEPGKYRLLYSAFLLMGAIFGIKAGNKFNNGHFVTSILFYFIAAFVPTLLLYSSEISIYLSNNYDKLDLDKSFIVYSIIALIFAIITLISYNKTKSKK